VDHNQLPQPARSPMNVRAIEFNLSAKSKHKSAGKRRSKGQKDGELNSIL
jgi:hypothetical protein